jgi:AcrR family transcriptional regulator
MGITERRERQKAELRETILAAASRIMAEEGWSALTMRKIADAIEYSPATIYLHFESRDEIAMQLVRDGFAALLAHMEPATRVADPRERIALLGRCYVDFARARPQTYRLIFMEDERFAEQVMARFKETEDADGGAFAFLTATVNELIHDGTFVALPPDTVAGLLWAALHGIASLKISCVTYPFPGDTKEPANVMIDALVRGFSRKPDARP